MDALRRLLGTTDLGMPQFGWALVPPVVLLVLWEAGKLVAPPMGASDGISVVTATPRHSGGKGPLRGSKSRAQERCGGSTVTPRLRSWTVRGAGNGRSCDARSTRPNWPGCRRKSSSSSNGCPASKRKICVVFEGRDGAGKGGVIKRITERVSPRVFRDGRPTHADGTGEGRRCTSSATSRTCRAGGEIVIFDRSWYNRAGVERVMGFCTEEEARPLPDAGTAASSAQWSTPESSCSSTGWR